MSLKEWAKSENAYSALACAKLKPGRHRGSLAVPFPVTDRTEYLAKIRGKGIFKRAEDVIPTEVQLDSLHAIQTSVGEKRLTDYLGGLKPKEGARNPNGGLVDYPVIVRIDGQSYVHDGHHRVTAAWCEGLKKIRARVVELT